MKQTDTLLSALAAYLLGRKYYANIVNTIGTANYDISAYIFADRAAADAHRRQLEGNKSYRVVETVTFRSRQDYPTTQL